MSNLDKKYSIRLDLINNIQNENMKFSLSDNETSDFYIEITKSMKKIDLTNKTVRLYVVKPNKNVIYTEITLYTEGNKPNVFYCDLPNNFKNVKGSYCAQILIEDIITGEKVVTPSKFSYTVESDIISEESGIIDTEENKNILDSILSDLADLKANKVRINDTTPGSNTTYSSNKIESIKEDLSSQISAIGGSGGSSGGMTSEQTQQLSAAYEHSQSTHAPSNAEANVQSDWNVIDRNSDAYIANKPTNVSEFANDANYTTKTYVDTAIENIEITGGGEVDLSGYVTKETGNANQITFTDGQTFQEKLEAGLLKGEQGEKGDTGEQGQDGLTTAISVNGSSYKHENGIITLPDYPTVPTKTSELTNDSDFVNSTFVANKIAEAQLGGDNAEIDLSRYATKDDIPTKTSQLINDSNFATTTEMSDAINNYLANNPITIDNMWTDLVEG